jgi:hypothetical protein
LIPKQQKGKDGFLLLFDTGAVEIQTLFPEIWLQGAISSKVFGVIMIPKKSVAR